MQKPSGVRGDYFTDRIGGITAIVLGLVSLGIVISRFGGEPKTQDLVLAALYVAEVLGAAAILPSKAGPMRVAFWLLALRVLAGIVFLGMFRDDKLARTTLAFPILEAAYCWVRIRALQRNP